MVFCVWWETEAEINLFPQGYPSASTLFAEHWRLPSPPPCRATSVTNILTCFISRRFSVFYMLMCAWNFFSLDSLSTWVPKWIQLWGPVILVNQQSERVFRIVCQLALSKVQIPASGWAKILLCLWLHASLCLWTAGMERSGLLDTWLSALHGHELPRGPHCLYL